MNPEMRTSLAEGNQRTDEVLSGDAAGLPVMIPSEPQEFSAARFDSAGGDFPSDNGESVITQDAGYGDRMQLLDGEEPSSSSYSVLPSASISGLGGSLGASGVRSTTPSSSLRHSSGVFLAAQNIISAEDQKQAVSVGRTLLIVPGVISAVVAFCYYFLFPTPFSDALLFSWSGHLLWSFPLCVLLFVVIWSCLLAFRWFLLGFSALRREDISVLFRSDVGHADAGDGEGFFSGTLHWLETGRAVNMDDALVEYRRLRRLENAGIQIYRIVTNSVGVLFFIFSSSLIHGAHLVLALQLFSVLVSMLLVRSARWPAAILFVGVRGRDGASGRRMIVVERVHAFCALFTSLAVLGSVQDRLSSRQVMAAAIFSVAPRFIASPIARVLGGVLVDLFGEHAMSVYVLAGEVQRKSLERFIALFCCSLFVLTTVAMLYVPATTTLTISCMFSCILVLLDMSAVRYSETFVQTTAFSVLVWVLVSVGIFPIRR